jgi:hypothetical protein
VTIRGDWYGCDTGCEGVAAFGDDDTRIAFEFSTAENEADAREILGVPDTTRVTFESGSLEP